MNHSSRPSTKLEYAMKYMLLIYSDEKVWTESEPK